MVVTSRSRSSSSNIGTAPTSNTAKNSVRDKSSHSEKNTNTNFNNDNNGIDDGDQDAHMRRFGYTQNANLVLRSGKSTKNEGGDSEIGSLWGHINTSEFGSLAQREKAPISIEKKKKKKSNITEMEEELDIEELATLIYRPRTLETRVVYEKLLELTMMISQEISGSLGRALLDEMLQFLNSTTLPEMEKKSSIETLLNLPKPMDSLEYSHLLALSKRLVDYEAVTGQRSTLEKESHEEEEESFGLTVVENEEEDGEEHLFLPEIESDEENDSKPILSNSLSQSNKNNTVIGITPSNHHTMMDIRDIDLHFLQRTISLPEDDAWEAHKRAGFILTQLQDRTLTGWRLEEKILSLLGPRLIEKVSLLISNRLAIVAGIELANAAGDGEAREVVLKWLLKEGPQGIALATQAETPRGSEAPSLTRDGIFGPISGYPENPIQNDDRSDQNHSLSTGQLGSEAGQRLEALARDAQEAQALAARRVPLPSGSWRSVHTGYEQVYVPGPAAIPMEVRDAICLPVSTTLPEWTHPAFEGDFSTLNRIQSSVFQDAFYSNENLLVSAPTGAGKTGIAFLAVLKAFGPPSSAKKIVVYVAPMRALVAEMATMFRKRLSAIYFDCVSVSELTGESGGGLGSIIGQARSGNFHLIVTTPEKWDIVTRKPTSDAILASKMTLLVVDEIHLIRDPMRGPTLEAIIARSKGIVRILGLSATLPNATQMHNWLGGHLHVFGPEWRPCPLNLAFYGFTERKASKRISAMNERLLTEILDRIDAGPVLVFVHSRKETARTARFLRDAAATRGLLALFVRGMVGGEAATGSDNSQAAIHSRTGFDSIDLAELVPAGIGIHHAGLSRGDRATVEAMFGTGSGLSLLVCTATLAWGVNLPAHTVIIRGTDIYSNGSWKSLPAQDVLQMWGRAGRPQFDRHGEALLFTAHHQLGSYVALSAEPVLSMMLHENDGNAGLGISGTKAFPAILGHLNAEIQLGTVRNSADACNWVLSRLFLGQMAQDDPAALGLSTHDSVESWVGSLVASLLVLLQHQFGFISGVNIKGSGVIDSLEPTELGRIASFYYLYPETAKRYSSIPFQRCQWSQGLILEHWAKALELIPFARAREEERGEIGLIGNAVPIPLATASGQELKAAFLLQAIISRIHLENVTLAMDASQLASIAPRLLRALFEISLLDKKAAGAAVLLLGLARAIERRCWSSSSPLLQILLEQQKENEILASEITIARIERREMSLSALRLLTPNELVSLVGVSSHSSSQNGASSAAYGENEQSGQNLSNGQDVTNKQLEELQPPLIHHSQTPSVRGRRLAAALAALPRLQISAAALPLTYDLLQLTMAFKPDWIDGTSARFWLFVSDLDCSSLLHSELLYFPTGSDEPLSSPSNGGGANTLTRTIHIPISSPMPPGILIQVLSDKYHHGDTTVPVSFRSLILPSDEHIPFGRILELAPVHLSQVRALYHVPGCSIQRDFSSNDSYPATDDKQEEIVLTPLERYLLWLLRLEPDRPLVLGLPMMLLGGGARSVIERMLEVAVGLLAMKTSSGEGIHTGTVLTTTTGTVGDITLESISNISNTINTESSQIHTRVVLVASPWQARRVTLGRTLAALFGTDIYVHVEQMRYDTFWNYHQWKDGDYGNTYEYDDIGSVLTKILSASNGSTTSTTHVILGDSAFLFRFLCALSKYSQKHTQATSIQSNVSDASHQSHSKHHLSNQDQQRIMKSISVSLVMEWGLVSKSQQLFQELLLGQIRRYQRRDGYDKDVPFSCFLSLLIIPSSLSSMKSLGLWVGASEDRILSFSDSILSKHYQKGPQILPLAVGDEENNGFESAVTLSIPFLLPLLRERVKNNSADSMMEESILEESTLLCDSVSITSKSYSAVVVCTPDIGSSMALAKALAERIAREGLGPLSSDPAAIEVLLENGATDENVEKGNLELLAAGIGTSWDPVAREAFRRKALSTLILPLSEAGEFFASFPFSDIELDLVVAYEPYSLSEEPYTEYALSLLSHCQSGGGSFVLFSSNRQRRGFGAKSTSFYKQQVIVGESILLSNLPIALAVADLPQSSEITVYQDQPEVESEKAIELPQITTGEEAFMQEALDYISQETWLRTRMEANPNYYHLAERSIESLSESLSENLESCCLGGSGDSEPTIALGRIAAHYGLGESLTRVIWPNLTQGVRLKSILSILAACEEIERGSTSWATMSTTTSKSSGISNELKIRLLNAIIDVCMLKSGGDNQSSGDSYLSTALAAMDLCQAFRQGMPTRKEESGSLSLIPFQYQLGLRSIEDAELICSELSLASVYELSMYVRS